MKKLLAFTLAFLCAAVAAQSVVQTPTQRLRGTVKAVDGATIVLAERSGETVTLSIADNFSVSEVVPIAITAIQPGSFIGTAAIAGAGGELNALEVLVFPEAARGTGEGHSAWDLQPGSTMTNATVAELASTPVGRKLKLRYKDGEKTVVVPDNAPIVTVKAADRTLLVPGAKVIVFAQQRDGKPTAMRALAGRDGFSPPM